MSQSAVANILTRAEAPLLAAAALLAAAVRESPVVGSDETSARIRGKTWWRWVLLGLTAICHVIADSRAASVVAAFMDGAQPEVWVADRHGGQRGHGATRQMGLAHLLRDAAYASEVAETRSVCRWDGGFAPGLRLLLRAMAIGKRRAVLKDSTLAQDRAGLERQLHPLLSGPMPERPAARRLFRAMCRDRGDLFRFVARRDVAHTNNACERAAALGDRPQGGGRVPRRMGRQGLCRGRQNRRHRALARADRSRSAAGRAGRRSGHANRRSRREAGE